MNNANLRCRFYRTVFGWGIAAFRRVDGRIDRKLQSIQKEFKISAQDSSLAWFHAASEGELECLWPVILSWAKQNKRIVVTVFSRSATRSLERLEKELASFSDVWFILGFSPSEGRWQKVLAALKPAVFVTAKYEAWPDLWMSLSILEIPLVIVGATSRSSFHLCKRILAVLGVPLPRLCLLTTDPADIQALKLLFDQASVCQAGEPRWDRVKARTQKQNPRAKELMERFREMPRPWGVLGQVWKEDLLVWRQCLAKAPGTLWIVPHRVDEAAVAEVFEFLREVDEAWVCTTSNFVDASNSYSSTGSFRVIVLNEMGVLSELYQWMDWAYIGGGFGRGVHSTIEPAIHGIPLVAGTMGAEKFSEITQLVGTGQLTLIDNKTRDRSIQASFLARWIEQALQVTPEQKHIWAEQAQNRLGATENVMSSIEEAAHSVSGTAVVN